MQGCTDRSFAGAAGLWVWIRWPWPCSRQHVEGWHPRPEAIVPLGCHCLVDLAPTACLSEQYGDDLAILWVGAHPDSMEAAQMRNAQPMCRACAWAKAIPALAGW